jgi:hypothetical protein
MGYTNVGALNTGAAASTAASLNAAPGVTNFLTHFQISGLGATAGSVIQITITGLLGSTRTYDYTVPAGVTVAAPNLEVNFPSPLPASGPNVAITVTAPSFGAGNTIQRVSVDGVQG